MVVLGCGACTDAILESQHWALGALLFVLLGLLAEGALFTVVTFSRRIETVSPRAFPAAVAAALFSLALLSPLGANVGLAAAALVLLPAAALSLTRNHRFSPALTWVRVAVIVAGGLVGLWGAWPAHRSTAQLLRVATALVRLRAVDGWISQELRSRPDVIPALERELDDDVWDDSALELHAALGGPREYRQAACLRRKTRPSHGPFFDEACAAVK